MIARWLLVAALALAACSPACPAGSQQDAARLARLRGLIAAVPRARRLAQQRAHVCYTPGLGRGVIADRLLVLDGESSDAELAAQLAHLLVHIRDGLGDGCAKGLPAAEASEADGTALEDELRARVGLPAAQRDRSALDDYRARCAAPR